MSRQNLAIGHWLEARWWLLKELTERELRQRYMGTALGILWPILNSLLFLTMFTFVFSVVLKVRWAGLEAQGIVGGGAVMIFCGMIPYLFFTEVIARSPNVITSIPQMVKRVKFPLPIFLVVNTIAALVLALINVVMLLTFNVFSIGLTTSGILYLPLLFIPMASLALGLSWLFSAVGVFFRDFAQVIPIALQLVLFLSPVFYPLESVPDSLRAILQLNPLTFYVEAFRSLLIFGHSFPWTSWSIQMVLGIAALFGGHYVFKRLQPHFADVL